MLSIFSLTGKPIKEAVDLVDDAQKDARSNFKKLSDPLLGVESFRKIIDRKKGYEYDDYITSLIKEKLRELSSGDESKKKVLIVDDLDRIDPDHLFRIISVFSAHIDHNTDDNKFGFDKIIFVGDVQNIKAIFLHKYGQNDSFGGFIAKLSSGNPFMFDPSRELYFHISKLLSRYKVLSDGGGDFWLYSRVDSRTQVFYNYIFCCLIYSRAISLRGLQNNKVIPIRIKGLEYIGGLLNTNNDIYMLTRALMQLIGTKEEVIQAVGKCQNSPLSLMNTQSGNLFTVSSLSAIPLGILLSTETKNEKNLGKHTSVTIGTGNFGVEYVEGAKIELDCKLEPFYGTERNLLAITLEAFKSVAHHIN